ncbi:hypothetical protein [Massilia oculi]|uniref:hypothetical protein n=1 Tax=Massilia oculi TaxID=945844 RepID=UPI0028AF6846|nr:hypothetical protein [Massilia oculi]
MNDSRVFVTFVSGLLGVDESRFGEIYAQAAQLCALDQAEVRRGEDRLTLRQWIEEQRAKCVTSVSILVEDASADAGHDPAGGESVRQMLSGFADGLPILMRVDTASDGAVHVQGTVSGPRLSLTPSLFLELINAQGEPDFFRAGVLARINAYRSVNGRDDIAAPALQTYLLSPEGVQDWEAIGQQLFQTVQADALTHEQSLAIPAGFAEHLEKTTPVDSEPKFTAWLDPYDEDDVTPTALLRLVKAQHFAGKIWRIAASRKLLLEKFGDIEELDDFPRIAAHDWPRFLSRLAIRDVARVSAILIELVRLECEERGIQPRIPDELSDIFGPSDEGRRRLEARERLRHDLGWTIREADAPSTLRVLDRDDRPAPAREAMPMAQARQQFIDALTQARDIAWRVDSPFDHVFGAARHLAMHAIDPGPLDPTALASPDLYWEPDMLIILQLFTRAFEPFGWGGDRLLGLAAVSGADLFGGANAWTGQALEGEDKVRFQAVSMKLFAALNRYFEALVSV